MSKRIEWVGFRPLKPDRIHVYCPRCGRRASNAHRAEYDPPTATLMHLLCGNCDAGCKVEGGTYFDDRGKEVGGDPAEWMKREGAPQ